MSINSRLSSLLDYLLEIQLAVPQRLTEAELARTGTADNWSIKDTLAHNAEWVDRHRSELETIERGQPWPGNDDDDEEEDRENQVIFETYRDTSWEEVREMLRRAYNRSQAYLGRVSEETLLAPLPADPERPIWRFLAGNHVLHPMIHVWEYLVKNGHSDLLDTWFGRPYTDRLLALSEDSGWQGTTLYNQACRLALTGKSEQAIAQLAEALSLEPNLKEWSQEDSDLDSLRDEPSFQALYD